MQQNDQESMSKRPHGWLHCAILSLAFHALVLALVCTTFVFAKMAKKRPDRASISVYLQPKNGASDGLGDDRQNATKTKKPLVRRTRQKPPSRREACESLQRESVIGQDGVRDDSLKDGLVLGYQGVSNLPGGSELRVRPTLVNGGDVKIPYPKKAKQLMIEGIVRLRLTVSAKGQVIGIEILSGPSFGLRDAALVVARKLQFLPATDELGHAKTAEIDHEVVFKLNRRS